MSRIGNRLVGLPNRPVDADTLAGNAPEVFAHREGGNTFTGAQRGTIVPVQDDVLDATPDFALGNLHELTMDAHKILRFPENVEPGMSGAFRIAQDATGGWTLSFAAGYRFPGGIGAMSLSTEPNSVCIIPFAVFDIGFVDLGEPWLEMAE